MMRIGLAVTGGKLVGVVHRLPELPHVLTGQRVRAGMKEVVMGCVPAAVCLSDHFFTPIPSFPRRGGRGFGIS